MAPVRSLSVKYYYQIERLPLNHHTECSRWIISQFDSSKDRSRFEAVISDISLFKIRSKAHCYWCCSQKRHGCGYIEECVLIIINNSREHCKRVKEQCDNNKKDENLIILRVNPHSVDLHGVTRCIFQRLALI